MLQSAQTATNNQKGVLNIYDMYAYDLYDNTVYYDMIPVQP